MNIVARSWLIGLVAILGITSAVAADDPYTDAIATFKQAGESGNLFAHAYGYALFPTVGKGGIGIGGAYGKGRLYRGGAYVGDCSLTQVSVGFQFGGQAYSEIVFFENKTTFDDFTKGNFEFGADASAVAITASASATASSAGGASASAGVSSKEASSAGAYHHGVAVFTIAKGGLMYQAAIAGQKFNYTPRGK